MPVISRRFREVCDGRRRRNIDRHTWKWVAGCVLAIAGLRVVPPRPTGGPRLRLAAGRQSFVRLALGVAAALSLVPIFGTYYGAGAALGGLSEAAEAASVHAQPAFGHRDRLHRHHPVRAAGRVRPPVPDRRQGARAGHLAVGRLAPGAHFRPADGPAGLCLCPDPGAGLRRCRWGPDWPGCWRSAAGSWALRAWPCWSLLLSFRHFAEAAAAAADCALFRFLPERHVSQGRTAGSTAFVQGVESTRSDGALPARASCIPCWNGC